MIHAATRSLFQLALIWLFATCLGISIAGAQQGADSGAVSDPGQDSGAESSGAGLNLTPSGTSLPSTPGSTNFDFDKLPGASDLSSFAPAMPKGALATQAGGDITLSAHLTEDSGEIPRGLVWRVFRPETGPDGKLPLVATAQGGTSTLHLAPGSYLVHAAFGRAGATKRIKVGDRPRREDLVLDAGGLELNAVLSGGVKIPPTKLRFSIYDASQGPTGERALIIPDVKPDTVVRLKAGTYHVVSTYGSVNAVIRSDIRVEAGKLTQATVEHRAAHLTIKLVREHGGEAIADTAWSVLTDTGDVVRETVGAYASMVLAEGDYIIIANNRDRIYQRDFTVVAGHNQDVELLPSDLVGDKSDENAGTGDE